MKEIVSKILEVIMCLIPFFGKGKRERVVREVRYNACLLYTSPSPRDMRRSRKPSSA